MASKSVITYIPPKERFVLVSNSIVDGFEPDVIGVYCKIIKLSSGKSLSIDFIAKKIGVNEKKVRRIIVRLEDAGYVVRTLLKGERGTIIGWDYKVYSEPVPEAKRSHAGKANNDSHRVTQNPPRRSTVKTENGKDDIIIDNTISNNNNKTYIEDNKKPTDVGKKSVVDDSLFPEQKSDDELFDEYMRANYPYIMKMDKPLTRQEAKKLKELYGEEIVLDVFNAMNNHKRLLRDYRSAYQTANNWCTRRIQNVPK